MDIVEVEMEENSLESPDEELANEDTNVLPNTTIESIDSETPLEEVQTQSTTAAPSPVQPRKNIDLLIPLNENCFDKSANFIFRGVCTSGAQRKTKSRAVAKIIHAVKDPSLSVEQQVFALREAVCHKELEIISTSPEILIDNKLIHYLIKNIKMVLKLTMRTRRIFGRASHSMRSVVQTVILVMLPAPGSPKKFSNRVIANFLHISEPSYKELSKQLPSKEQHMKVS